MDKHDIPSALPDAWLEFYCWACAEADRESEGTPNAQLFTNDGETL